MQNKFIEHFPLKYKFFHFFAQKELSVPLRNLSVMGIRLFASLRGSPIYTDISFHSYLSSRSSNYCIFLPLIHSEYSPLETPALHPHRSSKIPQRLLSARGEFLHNARYQYKGRHNASPSDRSTLFPYHSRSCLRFYVRDDSPFSLNVPLP